ncbi:endonuclease/exonuclease/phosphatase [Segetibacter sp. 3557_3]|uniref:endonuclease/exonuclease/phosphatase family protein n=1 Tax=Segetibacter sp. 3557_3 TaxID=2547429 RepID=UPI0010587710|nr:endonuclease/exonuclease/phosphatase family protein [Segetibacter sp. 3557_3]TDH27806.1 endonuclease/exonuclease/phosphatase [Segetibacter sp. 3557_3]
MAFYQNIDPKTPDGKRIIERLLVLRKKLVKEIPEKHLETNLILATWNIREFGTSKYGGRTNEALYYIAEIISKFDVIAVQEVRKDLETLKKLMGLLGESWEYMFTDITEGNLGNEERLTFIFDTRKVKFGGLAGEMVLPPMESKDPGTGQTTIVPSKQLARTPFMCGFNAGWTNFILTTVHILYGVDAAEDPERLKEISALANAMAARADGKYEWSNNIVLLGDFNIYSRTDSTLKAITDAKFVIPKELQSLPGSNVLKNKFYDQIAFKVRPNSFETTGKAGVFDFFECVYKDEDELIYAEEMGKSYQTNDKGEERKDKSNYYRIFWRTFKMSDHLPMWVEIEIDHTDKFLSSQLVPPQQDAEDTTAPSRRAPAAKKKAK